jgi:hypothetical protein
MTGSNLSIEQWEGRQLTDCILKVARLRHLSNVSRSMREHVSTKGYQSELDKLDQLEDDQEAP